MFTVIICLHHFWALPTHAIGSSLAHYGLPPDWCAKVVEEAAKKTALKVAEKEGVWRFVTCV